MTRRLALAWMLADGLWLGPALQAWRAARAHARREAALAREARS